MKICLARIHGRVSYQKPLNDILDSFYELYHHVTLSNLGKSHRDQFLYYNFSFDPSIKPKRTPETIEAADVIIIPSENAFQYHIPGYFHTNQMAKWREEMDKIKPFLKGKKVIVLRSDRADSEQLYKTMTFPGVDFEFSTIDEMDFDGGIHALKYHFITQRPDLLSYKKDYDFVYWGCPKNKLPGGKNSEDVRYKILKYISKQDSLKSFWIGRFSNIERNMKILPMEKIIPFLSAGRTTLCFNWLDPKATTSRYHEAMACKMIPLVWKNYDEDNTLVQFDWQRCLSETDAVNKIQEVSSNYSYAFSLLEEKYKEKLRPIGAFKQEFRELLMHRIGRATDIAIEKMGKEKTLSLDKSPFENLDICQYPPKISFDS